MRKISLLLALLMLLICMVSCGDDNTEPPTPTGTNAPEQTTEAPNETEAPTQEKETETDAPETPQDKWTARY